MARVICPACDGGIRISDRLKIGQRVICERCAEPLIVVRLDPLLVESAETAGGGEDEVLWDRNPVAYGGRVPDQRRHHSRYKNPDWELDDDDARRRPRGTSKKKIRRQRDIRRRRRDWDDA